MDVAPRRPDNRPMTFTCCAIRYEHHSSPTPAPSAQLIELVGGAVRQHRQAGASDAALHHLTLAQPQEEDFSIFGLWHLCLAAVRS